MADTSNIAPRRGSAQYCIELGHRWVANGHPCGDCGKRRVDWGAEEELAEKRDKRAHREYLRQEREEVHVLTTEDESGNCTLMQVANISGSMISTANFPLHRDDILGLVMMLTEALNDEELDELKDFI